MLRSSLAFAAAASLFVALPASAERRTITVPVPDALRCPGPSCTGGADPSPAAQGLRTVYLSFEGVTLTASVTADDARSNTSYVLSEVAEPGERRAIPAFDPADLADDLGASRAEIIQYTVDELDSIFEPYNVEFTTTRPAGGNYHMIVFGGTCLGVANQVCAGIAPLDCGDDMPRNIVFVFPPALSALELAPTAAQELAHAFGLAHTLDRSDVMFPQTQPDDPPRAFGAGQIPEGDERCNGSLTFQDSHQELMDIVGYRGQDTTGPELSLSSPAEGALVTADTPVVVEASDQTGVASVSLVIEGTEVDSATAPPYRLAIPSDTPLGQLFLTLRAVDELGNQSQLRVAVYFGTGAEEPCNDGVCADGLECVSGLCFPAADTGAIGDTCDINEDCQSSVCAEVDGDRLCSQRCASDEECPSGFRCRGATACWPVPEDSGGCAVGRGDRSALGGLGLALFALGWMAARRRS